MCVHGQVYFSKGGGTMFCQKCGAENSDSSVFCKKCGVAMNCAGTNGGAATAGAPTPSRKGLAVAVVAILLAVGCGLALAQLGPYGQSGTGGDDPAAFTPTNGTFSLLDGGSMNDKETVRYSGTIQITLKNGNMTYNMDVNKVKVADATIVQPTIKPISYESPNASSSVNRSTMNDMKECFPFLDQYYTTLIMCTFSDGHSTVDAYKFVQSDGNRAIYVSTDGIIYQWCEKVDDVGMSFILNGWTRTSNGVGDYN